MIVLLTLLLHVLLSFHILIFGLGSIHHSSLPKNECSSCNPKNMIILGIVL